MGSQTLSAADSVPISHSQTEHQGCNHQQKRASHVFSLFGPISSVFRRFRSQEDVGDCSPTCALRQAQVYARRTNPVLRHQQPPENQGIIHPLNRVLVNKFKAKIIQQK
jgi:hypothetical protein